MAKAKLVFTVGDIYGGWKLVKHIPGGGNGAIWEVAKDDSTRIMKLLKKTHDTARNRFIDEIKMIRDNQSIQGVMRFVESCDTDSLPDTLWYVMPRAITLETHLTGKPSSTIIHAIKEIAGVLAQLHEIKVSHRDLKPQNLFVLGEQYTIGDFGLVDYPEKKIRNTRSDEALGPIWTIAPEMIRRPERSDGLKADVYSLAKTLWILLTNIKKGFDGQYNPSGSVRLSNYQPSLYLNVIEALLVTATENDPKLRPDMSEFRDGLQNWLELNEDYLLRNKLDWIYVQQKLFPLELPERVVWTGLNSIVEVLNAIGRISNINHCFMPDSGGLDMKGAKLSKEDGFIEIDFGIPHIIKPKRLIFESFRDSNEWNYFILETDEIAHVFDRFDRISYEELTELSDGTYKPYDYPETYYYNHDEDLKGHRRVCRYFKGSFAIFCKTSSYNRTNSTYDGRHSKVGMETFRQYIQFVVDRGYRIEIRQESDGKWREYRYGSPMPKIEQYLDHIGDQDLL